MASLIKRRKKYSVVYTYIDSESGEKKQKWETCSTFQEAQRRKAEVEHQLLTGTFVAPNITTLDDLLRDYMELYGTKKWALSTYTSNKALIANYISPNIGTIKLQDITPKFMDQYYQKLLTMPAVIKNGHREIKNISPHCVKEIHKILRCAFNQAVKWELVARNPVERATLPKAEPKRRDIWTAQHIEKALNVCEDPVIYLSVFLAFACTMRMGEITGLTWDCVDVSDEAIANKNAALIVKKELSRVSKEAMQVLDNRDIQFVFPPLMPGGCTSLVLKAPKTKTSVRKIWIPTTLARLLQNWQREQQEVKELLGEEYQDFNLVIAQSNGRPVENRIIEKGFLNLIERADLPRVVFHSLRHSSVTYKLVLTQGDIKAIQGETGHAQAGMVTDTYAHIMDQSRKDTADLFEREFLAGHCWTMKGTALGTVTADSLPPLPKEIPEQHTSTELGDEAQELVAKLQKNPAILQQIAALLATQGN